MPRGDSAPGAGHVGARRNPGWQRTPSGVAAAHPGLPGRIWTLGEESRLPWPRPTLPKENALVDVRIGVTHTPKEIEVELADGTSPDAVVHQIEQALSGQSVLWLTDRRGRRVGIPAATVAYIELQYRQRGPPGRLRRRGPLEGSAWSTCSSAS